MKIAQVSHCYLPNIGGVEFYVYRLSRDLIKNGEHVEILTSDFGGYDLSSNFNEQVKYFHAFPVIFRNPFTIGLIYHMHKNNFDIIHVHSLQAFTSLIAFVFKKNAKFIITAHGVLSDNQNIKYKILWNIYFPIAKIMCQKSEKIIVLGEKEKLKMVNLFNINPEKIIIIPNGIDIPSTENLEIIKKAKDIKKGKHIILYSGRLNPTKNIELLIKSFAKTKDKIKDIQLVLVGPVDNGYKIKLNLLIDKLKISGDVIITNRVETSELFSYYSVADVFVSLGVWEGLPTTMLEAIYFNIPCIMFNSGGISDIIIDMESGLLVDNLDENIVSEKIILLLENDILNNKIRYNAKHALYNKYLWEKCFKKIYNEYIN